MSKNQLDLHPHAADTAVSVIPAEKARGWGADHAFLWNLGELGVIQRIQSLGWYVRHLANYNVLYGGVATSIALLVWMYLMSLIALLGCEFNAEYERADR